MTNELNPKGKLSATLDSGEFEDISIDRLRDAGYPIDETSWWYQLKQIMKKPIAYSRYILLIPAVMYITWEWILVSFLVWQFWFKLFGNTIGRHRYQVHKSFKPRNKFIHFLLLATNNITTASKPGARGPWHQAAHTQHHQYSETNLDPTTPWLKSIGYWKNWLWRPRHKRIPENVLYEVKKWENDKIYWWCVNYDLALVLGYIGILYLIDPLAVIFAWAIPMILSETYASLYDNYIHGNFLNRRFGYQNFKTKPDGELSTNFQLFGIIPLHWGESHHNNHHKYPAFHHTGYVKGEWDPAGFIIRHFLADKSTLTYMPGSWLDRKPEWIAEKRKIEEDFRNGVYDKRTVDLEKDRNNNFFKNPFFKNLWVKEIEDDDMGSNQEWEEGHTYYSFGKGIMDSTDAYNSIRNTQQKGTT